MKTINLISESRAFQPYHFEVTEYYGKETVGFRVTENEFVYQSQNMIAFDAEKKELPHMRTEIAGDTYGKQKLYYCSNEFYVVVDKGTIGFDNHMFVAKGSVTETDTELIVSVSLVKDNPTIDAVLSEYSQNFLSTSDFFNESLFQNLNDYSTSVVNIVKKAEHTPFLILEDEEVAVSVLLETGGDFRLDTSNAGDYKDQTSYKSITPHKTLSPQDYLFRSVIKNTVEIAQIQRFAHNVYGDFYAVVKIVYTFPKDNEELKAKFPDFYKEHCLSEADEMFKQFVGRAETVSYIPTEEHIGSKVIYQKLQRKNGYCGISNDIFQFMFAKFITARNTAHIMPRMTYGGSGIYDDDAPFIRVEQDELLVTLIQVDSLYKIMLYRCTGVVKYNDEYYVTLSYDDESEFFPDFTHASKCNFRKYHHRNACRNVEYLLCRGKIQPIKVSQEQYNSFTQNR